MTARINLALLAICLISWPFLGTAAKADDSKIKELQKQRLATVQEMARLAEHSLKVGVGGMQELREAQRMLLDAELDLCDSDKDRVAVLEKHLTAAKDAEKKAEQLTKAGLSGPGSVLAATADRLKIEIALARAKEKIEGRK